MYVVCDLLNAIQIVYLLYLELSNTIHHRFVSIRKPHELSTKFATMQYCIELVRYMYCLFVHFLAACRTVCLRP